MIVIQGSCLFPISVLAYPDATWFSASLLQSSPSHDPSEMNINPTDPKLIYEEK